MRHLNYSHLQYFYTVAKEKSVTRAAEELHLTPQTISGQLKLLDDAVGSPPFERAPRRRRQTLSDAGNIERRRRDRDRRYPSGFA